MSPVETKVKAGAGAGAVTGLITWLLVAYVFKTGLPPEVAALLPFVVTFAASTAAAWLAPHTARPPVPPPVSVVPPL